MTALRSARLRVSVAAMPHWIPRILCLVGGLASLFACRTPGTRSPSAGSPASPVRESQAPEEVDDDLYRTGREAYARGRWEEARTALWGFVRRECLGPERAVCRVVRFELARAKRRSGHPAGAAIDLGFLLREVPPGDRQAVAAERDEALAAMRSEWAKSKENLPVLLRFRDQGSGFEAEDGALYIDGRKVFDAKVPQSNPEGWVLLTSTSLAEGEHVLDTQVHFTDRSRVRPRGRHTIRTRSALEVKAGPVVVEIVSSEETSTRAPFRNPTLDVIVRQGTSD